MIDSTPAWYAFIRACIFLLQAVTPLSVASCVWDILFWSTTWHLPLALRIWSAAEVVFYIAFQVPFFRYLQAPAVHPPLRSEDERRALFRRVIARATPADLERHMCRWFKDLDFGVIRREDVKAWIAWAFFEGRIDADGKHEHELEDYVGAIERLLGKKFLAGTGEARPLRLTLDPVQAGCRSLLWYWCIGFVDLLTYVRLWRNGYHFHRQALKSFFTLFPFRPVALTARAVSPSKHITYWHRPHTSKKRLPVLFIHGIGVGLYPYVDFLRELNDYADDGGEEDGQVGIIAVEIMPISLRITPAALCKDDLCREIATILEHHGFDKCVVVSHSYGTIMTTHMLHDHTLVQKIDSVLLIDPVCFLLHNADVAYNFTVRKPIHANEYQLWYFATLDPLVAHTLSRRFFWTENVLWLEDLAPLLQTGMRVSVSLAGRDCITGTEAVGQYLAEGVAGSATIRTDGDDVKNIPADSSVDNPLSWKNSIWKGEGLEMLWFDNIDHGQVFDKPSRRARLANVVRRYCSGS